VAFDSRKLLKTLTAGQGSILVPHIEAYQSRGKFPEKWDIEIRNYKKGDKYFHPSSHCFTPPLELWQQMKGMAPREKISPALRRTFDCGHMWHGYLQSILVDMKFIHPDGVEQHIVSDIDTRYGPVKGSGTGDLVGVTIPSHGVWLVDIKTMNKPEFEQGASQYTLKKWEAQVNCYMDWFGFDKAMVLAISKDSPHAMREYQIGKNPQLLNEIYDRWGFVAKHMREGTKPEGYEYSVDPLLLNPGDSVYDAVVAKELDAS
jgi:hypothetical protein